MKLAYDVDETSMFSASFGHLHEWEALTKHQKKIVRRQAKIVWEEAFAESWLTQRGHTALVTRYPLQLWKGDGKKDDENEDPFHAPDGAIWDIVL